MPGVRHLQKTQHWREFCREKEYERERERELTIKSERELTIMSKREQRIQREQKVNSYMIYFFPFEYKGLYIELVYNYG